MYKVKWAIIYIVYISLEIVLHAYVVFKFERFRSIVHKIVVCFRRRIGITWKNRNTKLFRIPQNYNYDFCVFLSFKTNICRLEHGNLFFLICRDDYVIGVV